MAVATLIKPIPAILFVWLLLTRRFSSFTTAMGTIAAATLIGVLIFGAPVHLSFLHTLFQSSQDVDDWWCNQSLYGALNRCFGENWLHLPALAQPLWLIGSAVLVTIATVTTLKLNERQNSNLLIIVNFSLWLVTGLTIGSDALRHKVFLLLCCLDYCMLSFSVLNLANVEPLHHGVLLLSMCLGTAGLLLLYVLLVAAHSLALRTNQRSVIQPSTTVPLANGG